MKSKLFDFYTTENEDWLTILLILTCVNIGAAVSIYNKINFILIQLVTHYSIETINMK